MLLFAQDSYWLQSRYLGYEQPEIEISLGQSLSINEQYFGFDLTSRGDRDRHNSALAFHYGTYTEQFSYGVVTGNSYGEFDTPFLGLETQGVWGQFQGGLRMTYWLHERGINSHSIDLNIMHPIGQKTLIEFDWGHHSLLDNTVLFDEYALSAGFEISKNVLLSGGLTINNAKKESDLISGTQTGAFFRLSSEFGRTPFRPVRLPITSIELSANH